MNFSIMSASKFSLTSLVLMCFSLFGVGVLCVSTTSAEIDPDTIVGMWLFDEGKGNVATDDSGNGLEGEFEGKPKWVKGQFGQALEFDGKGAFVRIAEHANPTKAITVSAWAADAAPKAAIANALTHRPVVLETIDMDSTSQFGIWMSLTLTWDR